MALGTSNIRELLEIERPRQRAKELTPADRPGQNIPEPFKPVRRGPGAQAAPAAAEEPLQPADSPLEAGDQLERRYQQKAEMAAELPEAASVSEWNRRKDEVERSKARQAASEAAGTAVKDGVTKAAAIAAKLIGLPSQEQADAAKEWAVGAAKGIKRRSDREKNRTENSKKLAGKFDPAEKFGREDAETTRLRELKKSYDAYVAENPWAQADENGERGLSFEDFIEMSLLDEDGNYDPRTVENDAMEITRNVSPKSGSEVISDGFYSEHQRSQIKPGQLKVEAPDGRGNKERDERRALNNARFNDPDGPNADAYDEKHMKPNTPDELQPRGGNASSLPMGGNKGKGKRYERGMDMGGVDGTGEEISHSMLADMTKDKWDKMSGPDREAHVMFLAGKLGVDVSQLPPDQQYYGAKRAVMEHLFKTGNAETKIWANEEGDLGHDPHVMDLHARRAKGEVPGAGPEYKAYENKFNENTGQWEIHKSDAAKEKEAHSRQFHQGRFRDHLLSGTIPASDYLNEDGTWKEGGVERFQQDHAGYLGRRGDGGEAAQRRELQNAQQLMQRQMNYQAQKKMRANQQNMDGPIGRQMYIASIQQASTPEEKRDIALAFGNKEDADRYEADIRGEQAVRSAAAGAKGGDPTAADQAAGLNSLNNQLIQAAANGGSAEAARQALDPDGSNPVGANAQVAQGVAEQWNASGHEWSPQDIHHQAIAPHLEDIANDIGGAMFKGDQDLNLGWFGKWKGNESRSKDFVKKALASLGLTDSPEMEGALRKWFYEYHNDTAPEPKQGDELPEPPDMEAPPEEDLTPPPKPAPKPTKKSRAPHDKRNK